jgi:membrane fusion protein, copper/silver efflux system
MKNIRYSISLFLVVVGACLIGAWYTQRGLVKPAAGMPAASAPMHEGHEHPGRSVAALSPGSGTINAERRQLVGVRVSAVETASPTHTLRLLGRVAPDETRVYKVNAGIDGFIREVAPVTTGSQVKKDQVLATFSAPASLSVIQLYILNVGAVDRLRQRAEAGSVEAQAAPAGAANIQQRVDQLQNLGMSVLQMEEIKRTREIPESIRILAPADGFVLSRNVSPGLKFEKGAEWYRIADLKRVWIIADVFENEAQYARRAVHARVSLPNQRVTLPASVSEVLPQFDAATRTLRVRLEADNPAYALRPDMFVDVELPITLPRTVVVPIDAVLDSGLKKTVFVERGAGAFEAREVETGWRLDGQIEILKGLAPGERIVTSGTFFLDSETRMRPGAGAGNGTLPEANAGHGAGQHGAHGHGAHDHVATH